MTPREIRQTLTVEFAEAHKAHLRRRSRVSYSSGSIPQQTVLLGPTGEILTAPTPWGDEGEMREWGRLLATTAKDINALGIVISSDVFTLDYSQAVRHFNLDAPGNPPLIPEQTVAAVNNLLHEKFEGSISNMPRELIVEAIVSICKSPHLPDKGMSTPYRQGPEDKVLYEATDTEMQEPNSWSITTHMIPAWW